MIKGTMLTDLPRRGCVYEPSLAMGSNVSSWDFENSIGFVRTIHLTAGARSPDVLPPRYLKIHEWRKGSSFAIQISSFNTIFFSKLSSEESSLDDLGN